jgi:hypothetical protein
MYSAAPPVWVVLADAVARAAAVELVERNCLATVAVCLAISYLATLLDAAERLALAVLPEAAVLFAVEFLSAISDRS